MESSKAMIQKGAEIFIVVVALIARLVPSLVASRLPLGYEGELHYSLRPEKSVTKYSTACTF